MSELTKKARKHVKETGHGCNSDGVLAFCDEIDALEREVAELKQDRARLRYVFDKTIDGSFRLSISEDDFECKDYTFDLWAKEIDDVMNAMKDGK